MSGRKLGGGVSIRQGGHDSDPGRPVGQQGAETDGGQGAAVRTEVQAEGTAAGRQAQDRRGILAIISFHSEAPSLTFCTIPSASNLTVRALFL